MNHATMTEQAEYARETAAMLIARAEAFEACAVLLNTDQLKLDIPVEAGPLADPGRACRLVKAIGGIVTADDLAPFLGNSASVSLDAAVESGAAVRAVDGYCISRGRRKVSNKCRALALIASGTSSAVYICERISPSGEPSLSKLRRDGIITGRTHVSINPDACKADGSDQGHGDWAKGDDS